MPRTILLAGQLYIIACYNNRVEFVQLFLAHASCSKDIVRMENIAGATAEMEADIQGNHECARLVREYLENNDDEDGDRNKETKLDDLILTEIAKRIEEMNDNEDLIISKTSWD